MAATFKSCSIDGCNKPHVARGLCRRHYDRWRYDGDILGGGTLHGDPLRFIYNVALAYKSDGCLIWPFTRNKRGYGLVDFDGKARRGAHRVVCILAHGEPPTQKHEAAHSCGKGHLGCVNPNHLRWATPAENSSDKLIHGTMARGERHGKSKVSAADVERIRSLRGKLTQLAIGRQFGITPSQVCRIQTGESWVS